MMGTRRVGVLKYNQWVPCRGYEKRVWQRGVGPCGKNVLQLWAEVDAVHLTVYQYCEGQPDPDIFTIKLEEISGAIQMFPEQQGPRTNVICTGFNVD